eukprot:4105036-Alexandrium_andersonii.AAC.1
MARSADVCGKAWQVSGLTSCCHLPAAGRVGTPTGRWSGKPLRPAMSASAYRTAAHVQLLQHVVSRVLRALVSCCLAPRTHLLSPKGPSHPWTQSGATERVAGCQLGGSGVVHSRP